MIFVTTQRGLLGFPGATVLMTPGSVLRPGGYVS
jgi:hypothetical protein